MASEKTAPDVIKAQNAAAQAQEQQRKEQQALDYFNAMDNFYLRKYSDKVNKTLSDQIQADQFKDALAISDQRKDTQLRLFDESERRYRDQLEFNQDAYNTSGRRLQQQYGDLVRSYDDQLTDQDRAFDAELASASFEKQALDQRKAQLQAQFGEGGLQRRQDQLSLDTARSTLTQRAAARSADATRQSSLQQAEEQFQAQTVGSEEAAIQRQRELIQQTRVQKDLIISNLEKQADLEELQAITNRDNQLSEIAFNRQGQRIESLRTIGQAKARGRKGVSADRTLNTTLALRGINVARLTKQVFFVNEQFEQAQAATQIRRDDIGYQDALERLNEADAVAQLDKSQFDLTAQSGFDTATRTAQNTAATALRTAEASADARELERLDTQSSLYNDLALNQFAIGTDEADLQIDRLSYALGLSAEQLTMNKERLADSLISGVANLDEQLLALEKAKYQADYNAHAARMLPPEFAPDARTPYDVPLPKYIEPRPGAAPSPAYMGSYIAPPTQSGLSQALMIGGAALSVAAIPFTLGASGVFGAGATIAGISGAANLGGVAAGLGGLSAGLNTLSQSPSIRY
jgi:hypothetical protein